jgi:plastocyanin
MQNDLNNPAKPGQPATPPNKESGESSDVSYIYMPRIQRLPEPLAHPPDSKPAFGATAVSPASDLTAPTKYPARSRKLLYISLGSILALGLAGFGIYWLVNKSEPPPQPASPATRLPKVWLLQHFNVEICEGQTVCGDEADPDKDGLNNYNEFKHGTNPNKADSDQDGLSDGDEINIYKTEPDLKYTDRREIAVLNDYSDSHSFKNGFDPLTPGLLITETRKKQIAEDTAEFGLHEPTITTFKEPEPPPGEEIKTYTVFIEGNKFVPDVAKINVGDTVVWLNKDLMKHKIASNPHPQHTDLPLLISPELTNSQTYSFQFENPGKFGYHDHLNSSISGTVEVSEANANPSP